MSGLSASSSDVSRSVSFCRDGQHGPRHGGAAAHLLVVLAPTAAGFDEDEALGTLEVFIAKGAALPVFDREIVRGTIDEFKRGKDLGELALDGFV
jgi:hypothetical protein